MRFLNCFLSFCLVIFFSETSSSVTLSKTAIIAMAVVLVTLFVAIVVLLLCWIRSRRGAKPFYFILLLFFYLCAASDRTIHWYERWSLCTSALPNHDLWCDRFISIELYGKGPRSEVEREHDQTAGWKWPVPLLVTHILVPPCNHAKSRDWFEMFFAGIGNLL